MKPGNLFLVVVLVVLTGCSGLKTYPDNYHKNLHIVTDKDSNTLFSKLKISVDIHKVNQSCEIQYQGTVKLDEKNTSVGIPTGDAGYLAFYFENSSFWANSNSSIHYDTLLMARDGYRYNIRVSYIDDIYNVRIEEVSARGERREVKRKSLTAC